MMKKEVGMVERRKREEQIEKERQKEIKEILKKVRRKK